MLPEGSIVGPYRLTKLLGVGGIGAVYLGEHTLLGRKAAIKVLLPEVSADASIVERFFNEARAVTQIADPGIVQIFDFGHDERGRAYIVMELLDGETLAARLHRLGQLGVVATARLVWLMALSLESAHAHGIVHRDLKPENVFLVSDPAVTGGERAKILDFGIAKLSRDRARNVTRTGTVMGTPLYMSPEQCRGDDTVDHRSDIYALGCVMFTMLTGRPLFDYQGTGALIIAHVQEPPPLASSCVPGIPPAVDRLIERCLAKEPAQRFQSMAELARSLAEIANHAPGEHPVPPVARARRPGAGVEGTTLSGATGAKVATKSPPRRRGVVLATAAVLIVGGVVGVELALRGDNGASSPAPGSAATVTPAPVPSAAPRDAGVASDAGSNGVADVVPDAGATAATPPPPNQPGRHHVRTSKSGHGTPDVDRGD